MFGYKMSKKPGNPCNNFSVFTNNETLNTLHFYVILLPLVPVACALFQETPALFGSSKIEDINCTP